MTRRAFRFACAALVGFRLGHRRSEDPRPLIGAARVDPPHEILANELCTLLSRSELREFIADLKDRLARAAFPGPRA